LLNLKFTITNKKFKQQWQRKRKRRRRSRRWTL